MTNYIKNLEPEVITVIYGEVVYRCPLKPEQCFGRTIGMTKSGKCYKINEDGTFYQYVPTRHSKGQRKKRHEFRVYMKQEEKRFGYNIARLMAITFFTEGDGTPLDIKGDWTVDHLVLKENDRSSGIESDTTHWQLHELDVCTREENRERFKRDRAKYLAGELAL